jgi:hypothetical protein
MKWVNGFFMNTWIEFIPIWANTNSFFIIGKVRTSLRNLELGLFFLSKGGSDKCKETAFSFFSRKP